jgi:hypothetical protein
VLIFMAWGVGMGALGSDVQIGVPMLPLMGVGQ